MKSIGLRAYVWFSFVLFGALIAVMTTGLLLASNKLRTSATTMNAAVESITAAQSVLDRLEANRRRILLNRQHGRKAIERDLKPNLRSIELYIDSPEERQLVDRVNQQIERFLVVYNDLERRGVQGRSLYLGTANAFDVAVADISQLIELNQRQAQVQEIEAMRASDNYKLLAVALWGVVLTSVGLLLWMFHALVSVPIRRLHKAIEAFSSSQTLPALPQHSLTEISGIAAKFHELTVTLQRQSEQRLTFLAAVAHDLKNPLGAIQMSLDLLTDSQADGGDEIAGILRRQVQQLRRLVDDLLDATRIEAGQLELKTEGRDLRAILGDCVAIFKSVSSSHSFEFTSPELPVEILCDELRLGQVFNNILSNAIKYSPAGGRVQVRLKTAGDFAIAAIQDSGIGITGEDIAGIFEPFRRPSSHEHQISGVGLGLSTSRKIVEAHRGWIQVQSMKGRGSVFFVVLPLLIAAGTSPRAIDAAAEFSEI